MMRLQHVLPIFGLLLAAPLGCGQEGALPEEEASGSAGFKIPTQAEQLVEQVARAKLVAQAKPETTGVWERAGTATFVTPNPLAIINRQPKLARGVPEAEGSAPLMALADGRQYRMRADALAALGGPSRESAARAFGPGQPADQDVSAPRAQIGADNRIRIANSNYTKYPYRAVGTIMSNKTDATGWCTASLIGPRLAITAGHCVYDDDTNAWLWNTWFSPGHRGAGSDRFPNGTPRQVVGLISFKGWFTDEDPDHDVGFLILADQPQTASLGWFGFGWWSGSLDDVFVGTFQYPGANYFCAASPNANDSCGGYQYYDGDVIQGQCGNLLEYEIDTNPGSSGSPAFRYWNGGERWIVGPHAYGFSPCDGGDNKAVRMGKYKAGVACDLFQQFPSAYASRSCG
jgi:V8-like Glu-specific endopeptidase